MISAQRLSASASSPPSLTSAGQAVEAALRERVDEFVGLFFYGTLLKSAREHPLTDSKLAFGGRGESAFGAQLDQELAQRAGQARSSKLSEAIVRQLKDKLRPKSSNADAIFAAPAGGRGSNPPAVRNHYDAAKLNESRLDVTH